MLFDFIFSWIFASIVGNEIILILETLVVCLGYVCNKNDLQVEPEWVEKDEKKN